MEIRLETKIDYRIVEEVTREAFWNVHFPGCDEHLLIHNIKRQQKSLAMGRLALFGTMWVFPQECWRNIRSG